MYFFVQWSFDRGFIRYVEDRENQLINGLVNELSAMHAADAGWDKLAASPERWLQLVKSAVGSTLSEKRLALLGKRIQEEGWPPRHLPKSPTGLPLPLEFRTRLMDAQQQIIYGMADEPLSELELHPIKNGSGETVGYLGMRKEGAEFSAARDLQFSQPTVLLH